MTDPAPSFQIRPARPEDVSPICSLIREMAEYENLTHQLELDEEILCKSLFGENPVPRALVADANGIVIGYALYFYNFSTFIGKPGIYLEDLYVRTEYRKNGVGDALFKHVAQTAWEEGCGRMEWMALDWNANAISFYKSRGASLLDEWRLLRLERADLKSLLEPKAEGERPAS